MVTEGHTETVQSEQNRKQHSNGFHSAKKVHPSTLDAARPLDSLARARQARSARRAPRVQSPARTRWGLRSPSRTLAALPSPPQWYGPPPPTTPRPDPRGRSHRPRSATPTQLRKWGLEGTTHRGTAGGPDATIAGGGRSGTRAGALTCHRQPRSLSGGALPPPIATLRWFPFLLFPSSGYGARSGGGDAFSEPGPTARAARPPPPPPPPPSPRLPPPPTLWTEIPPSRATNRK
ncbi:hypothetical protein H8959_005903 [Pygathrix nigripes]